MSVRRAIALLCAPPLALGVGACGNTVSTGSFKGERQQVAQVVAHLQSHATSLDAKKICREDLAAASVARLNGAGGCRKAIEGQLKEIDNFETSVESVQIAGNRATAQVKSVRSGKKAIGTVTFVREGSRWRISGLS